MVPQVEGLPILRRWHVVNNAAKTLSPAAEAFRYFVLEQGESFLAQQFPEALLQRAAKPSGRDGRPVRRARPG